LHIYLLHAPDFLGYPSVVEMAREHRAVVERGLALKKAGNTILEAIGGRAIHPINVRVGGFYRAPSRTEMTTLAPMLRAAVDDAVATVDWVAGFDFPDFRHEHELLALVEPGRYAIDGGQPRTDRGFEFDVRAFDASVREEQVPHSTALQARLAGRGRYLTGPLARYALSGQWLSERARAAADAAGLGHDCRNPFRSIVVRGVELVYAVEEALRLVESYEPPEPPGVMCAPRAGVGCGATEAPRGTLFHRFELDAAGSILDARIVPPTSQNQGAIEDDLRRFVEPRLGLDDHRLTHECEQAIRNYDPCISCATHFLDLFLERM
jgi:coenzyme F420-reducing hydrogenase alpha subunit